MRVFTVATHADGWWAALAASAARGGYDLVPLGWGRPWGGFAWRLGLLADALAAEPDPAALAAVVDAYDVVLLEPAAVLAARYAAATGGGGAVLVGVEAPLGGPGRALKAAVFGRGAAGHTLNAGAYVGPAGALRAVCAAVAAAAAALGTADDQKALNRAPPPGLAVDAAGDVLFHAACPSVWGLALGRCGALGLAGLVNPRTGRRPCVLHAPGGADLDPVCRALGLPPGHRPGRLAWLARNYWRDVLPPVLLALVVAVAVAVCAAVRGAKTNAARPR